ncbi:deoxyguanosinetriphosphate triphosphohydrolase [Anaerofustis sp. NSJ-163]|uniref:deoxyguanosinetriphosphate triphosphohydrolase n=1 Tax=Anaerofustis sp. NSJ-163 TaxID=2944391 RepID=UPI00209C6806|nr:deoxyguanosinetriphosphate triphosphohydrolase [Anaerofustis sp. NSJ-163]MCO8194382.1 deoxyguanosinetriphosphate triphosphohydrolase [Anaerofustis sp. NSJ-163]
MNIRKQKEQEELKRLSKYAFKVVNTKGRKKEITPCEIRTDFERDRDRIIHSKSFRRLKHKTQVFISPETDHNRTRLTHTLEVSQISRSIARALCLNEDLTEAIALGHDLGHTPFGHSGEQILNEICPFEFKHNLQSVRVVEEIESEGKGLNLTYEVIDGIKNHCHGFKPSTLEGEIVFFSDKIAYINHDIDDAIRFGVLKPSDIPKEYTDILGETNSKRINTMILDIINNSYDKNKIKMSDEIFEATMGLRSFLFKNVYHSKRAMEEGDKGKTIVKRLYEYFMKHPDKMLEEFYVRVNCDNLDRVVCDYVACMSDIYAINMYKELFIPNAYWGM